MGHDETGAIVLLFARFSMSDPISSDETFGLF